MRGLSEPKAQSTISVVHSAELSSETQQTPGSLRMSAIAATHGIASSLWAGIFVVEPSARTGIHHHGEQDTIVYVLEGEATLVTDAGEFVLGPGMAAGFPAGRPDGHHLINRGTRPVHYLEIGTRAATEEAHYSDIDMMGRKRDGVFSFLHKNGEPYP